MPLSPGDKLGPYEILCPLGKGGMGEVYRARDAKLNREVAIKVLPRALADDADYRSRFEREAQVLASLNHPNIAAIYGLESNAIVMELVEGESPLGRKPLKEALDISRQIAEALEAAHERGIIHRDLKPGNVKVTPEGVVKVLDFGLAKSTEQPQSSSGEDSPTISMRATQAGLILGTAGYMSPEQAAGKRFDRRTDIWAFGVVLYELLTGDRLFHGETVSHTLADVLRKEIDFSKLPRDTPPRIRELIARCLDRNLKTRLRDIGEARIAIDNPGAKPDAAPQPKPSRWPWVAAGVLAVAALVGWYAAWRATRPVEYPLTRLSVDLGPNAIRGFNLTAAISPDGRRIVFPARGADGRRQLATRLLDEAQPTLLPGTEYGSDPFFSPDGHWIAFFASGRLKKISAQGGAPMSIQAAGSASFWGGSWGENGDVVAAVGTNTSLSRFSDAGGARRLVTKLAPGENTHRWPQVLLGANAVLFTACPNAVTIQQCKIEAASLKTGQVKILEDGGYFGRYLPTGHLIYIHEGVLFGVKFDKDTLEVRGTPVPLVEDVAANTATGGGQYDVSTGPDGHGTLVYRAGKTFSETWQVNLLDSSGRMQPLLAEPGQYTFPRFSPDGQKLAFTGDAIYIRDLQRGSSTRLTFAAASRNSVWAPDGRHIAYRDVGKDSTISWVRSDGSGEPQTLLESPANLIAWSFTSDGRRLAYFEAQSNTGFDIWTLPLDLSDPDHPKPGKPEPFLRTPADEMVPQFSPDGRWIAYRSNETGQNEIFIRPFPAGSGGKWQISSSGGNYALWAPNGRELFYETLDNRIMVLDYKVDGASFIYSKPRLWSDRQLFNVGTGNLDLAPDGKHFAVLWQPEPAADTSGSVHVTMLLNFFDEVRRKIP
jgi:serine/threonine-protein kinase